MKIDIAMSGVETIGSKEVAIKAATARVKKRAVKDANSRIKEQSSFGDKFFTAYWEVQHLIQKEHKDILAKEYGLALEPWEYVTGEEFDELLAIEKEISKKVAPAFEQREKIEIYSVSRRYNQVKWLSEKDFA